MIKRIFWVMALFMLIACGLVFAQNSPSDVHKKVANTISKEGKAQLAADDWSYEKTTLIDKIRLLKYNINFNKYRQEKHKIYIQVVNENIKNLEFKKDEIRYLRKRLDPYLEDVVDQMEAFIENDLPFLKDERSKRINGLRDSLNNYDVQMSEKMRRVFAEGLQIETEYGKALESMPDETLTLDGIETQVTLLRLGRLKMYYMSLDERQIGQFNEETGKWEALPDDLLLDFKLAFDMATGSRGAEIVELPLGAIKNVE